MLVKSFYTDLNNIYLELVYVLNTSTEATHSIYDRASRPVTYIVCFQDFILHFFMHQVVQHLNIRDTNLLLILPCAYTVTVCSKINYISIGALGFQLG